MQICLRTVDERHASGIETVFRKMLKHRPWVTKGNFMVTSFIHFSPCLFFFSASFRLSLALSEAHPRNASQPPRRGRVTQKHPIFHSKSSRLRQRSWNLPPYHWKPEWPVNLQLTFPPKSSEEPSGWLDGWLRHNSRYFLWGRGVESVYEAFL